MSATSLVFKTYATNWPYNNDGHHDWKISPNKELFVDIHDTKGHSFQSVVGKVSTMYRVRRNEPS